MSGAEPQPNPAAPRRAEPGRAKSELCRTQPNLTEPSRAEWSRTEHLPIRCRGPGSGRSRPGGGGGAGPGRAAGPSSPIPRRSPFVLLPFPAVPSPPPCAARTWRRRWRRGTEQRQRSAAAQVRGRPGAGGSAGLTPARRGEARRGSGRARARSPAQISSLLSARPGRRLSALPGPGAAVTARTCWWPSGTGPPGGRAAPRGLPGRALPPGKVSSRALLFCRVSPGRASGSRGTASPRGLGAGLGAAGAASLPGAVRYQPDAPGRKGEAGTELQEVCRRFARRRAVPWGVCALPPSTSPLGLGDTLLSPQCVCGAGPRCSEQDRRELLLLDVSGVTPGSSRRNPITTVPGEKLRLLRSRPESSAGIDPRVRQDLSVSCTVRCVKITPLTAGSCRAGLIRKLFEAPV